MDDEIKDEFKYDLDDLSDDEYEKILDKDIAAECGLNVYVDKLEEIEEIQEEKLLKMEKKDIIDYKNGQIQKLKAYILSLEREKEDIIENFKNTTNILLEKIKQKEFEDYGVRPQTAMIVENIKETNINSYNMLNSVRNNNNSMNNYNNYNNNNFNDMNGYKPPEKKKVDIIKFDDDDVGSNISKNTHERCANCKKEIPKENSIAHSLDCFRNYITCKVCKELISVKFKKEHLNEWRTKEVILT